MSATRTPPPSSPRRLATRVVACYPYIALLEHDVAFGGGEAAVRQVVTLELRDWCVVAARDESGRWILVEQHRHGVDGPTLEPAGGIVDASDGDPMRAALRELLEETGHRAEAAEPLGWVHPNPALSANRAFLYYAPRAVRVGDPQGAIDELTRVVLLDDAALADAVASGRVTHALAALALERARARSAEASP